MYLFHRPSKRKFYTRDDVIKFNVGLKNPLPLDAIDFVLDKRLVQLKKIYATGSRTSVKVKRERIEEAADVTSQQPSEKRPRIKTEAVPERASLPSADVEDQNGLLPYLQFDLNKSPKEIAADMKEGVNIPALERSIPVDSSSLPEGWEKRVIQRSMPNGKFYFMKSTMIKLCKSFTVSILPNGVILILSTNQVFLMRHHLYL